MDSTVFTLMFAASAPIVLLPTVFALFAKSRRASLIAGFNLLLWGALYLTVKGALGAPIPNIPGLSLIVVLLAWLVLLRFAATEKKSGAS